jgi:N-ethylmaleimide reductase
MRFIKQAEKSLFSFGMSHPDFHGGALPVAPSAIAAEGDVFTQNGKQKMVAPRALEPDELPRIVEDFRKAAQNAKSAGFDGVELHGANSYLLDQFLRDSSNHRTDRYGGSIENRVRFPLEVLDAVIGVLGADRVGYRISPYVSFNSMSDSNPESTFSHLVRELNDRKIGYLHIFEGVAGPAVAPAGAKPLSPVLRELFHGALIVNGGYDQSSGTAAIENGLADLVAYGVPFIANPDLPERFRQNAALKTPNFDTLYSGEGEVGYTDY